MKRYSIALLLLAWIAYCNAEETYSVQESFLKAHQLYQEKKYAQAAHLYESVPSKSSETLYNIGNCYYHMQQYSKALLYWERARKNATSQLLRNITYNIHVLESDLQKPGISSLSYFLEWTRAFFSLLFLQFIVLLALLMLIALMVLRPQCYFIMSMLCVSAIGVMSIVMYIHYNAAADHAIVMQRDVNVYAGPAANYAPIGALQEADKVTIGKHEDTWYKITHGTVTGWVSSSSLEIV